MRTIPQRIIPPPPTNWSSWESLMQLALDAAILAQDTKEVPVGAIIVERGGLVIGGGYNTCIQDNDPTAHAEINAIRNACATVGNYRLNDAFLVVTLEPCLMCCGAIVHSRLAGVIYGAGDDKAGAMETCLESFALPFINHSPWFMGGVMVRESQCLLQSFFERRRI